MQVDRKLLVTERAAWRTWLADNHATEPHIWLIRYKKHTGKPSLPYDDAVEEALCYGWIDGIVKRLDAELYAIRFTPRRRNSIWSDLNRKRAQKMIRAKLMTPAGMREVRAAKENGRWQRAAKPDISLEMPAELLAALAADERAFRNFENLPPSHRKMFIGWINSAKRPETKARRISKAVNMASKNEKPGML